MLTALSAVLSPYHANWSIKGFLFFIYLLYCTYRPNISAGRGRAVELRGLRMLSATTIYRKLTQHDGTPPSEGVKSLPVTRPLRPRFHVTEVLLPPIVQRSSFRGKLRHDLQLSCGISGNTSLGDFNNMAYASRCNLTRTLPMSLVLDHDHVCFRERNDTCGSYIFGILMCCISGCDPPASRRINRLIDTGCTYN
jgi:hypothetical protein